MNHICVIPARGGSKRIPKKNIKIFRGKPMIAWSIEIAKKTGIFEKIIVSTDCLETKIIAQKYHAEVPFLRPACYADDFTDTRSVIVHAIDELSELGLNIDFVCCLYATAPFAMPKDILSAIDKVQSSISSISFPVTEYEYPIERALSIDKDGMTKIVWEEFKNSRSQDLTEKFHDVGQFYYGHKNRWKEERNLLSSAIPIVIPKWRVQDIDNPEDWIRAEIIHEMVERRKTN